MKDKEPESKYENLNHSFFVARESCPVIQIRRTRRRRESPTNFAPMASMASPAIARVWKDTGIANILIPEDYIHCCVINPITYDEVADLASKGEYVTQNTVLIEYRTLSVAMESVFGVFLVHIQDEDYYAIREFMRLKVNRYIARPAIKENGQGTIQTHTLKSVKLQKLAKNNALSYYHQFTYKHDESGESANFYIPIYSRS